MKKPLKYAVFGAGSWATAIVKMLCENLDTVGWYMRSSYTLEHLKKEQHNPSYLSSVEFNVKQLKLSNDINEMAEWADVLIFVIPSAFMHKELEKLTSDITKKTIVSAVKGIIQKQENWLENIFMISIKFLLKILLRSPVLVMQRK